MNHTTVYVIICVILASVELWNASACHTGRWHATPPIHTYIHTWTNTWAFLHDRTVCDDLAACTAQCTANAAGSPGTAHMQPRQWRDKCFVSCLTISRLERHPADSLVTFWMTARVNHSLSSPTGLFIWRLEGGVQRGCSQRCGDGGLLVQEGQQRL